MWELPGRAMYVLRAWRGEDVSRHRVSEGKNLEARG